MKTRAGFTLLELLIVIAIIGIISAVGLPNLRRDTPQVRDAARVITADLNRVRSEAIRLNTSVGVTFNPSQGSYRAHLVNSQGTAVPNDGVNSDIIFVGVAANGDIFQRALTTEFPQAALPSTTFTNNTFWFDVRGLPRNSGGGFGAGTIVLTSKRDTSYKINVTVAAQGRIERKTP